MKIPDIDLNDLDTFEAGLPHEWFRRLRKEAPVYWHDEPDGPGYWVVTKYEDLRSTRTFDMSRRSPRSSRQLEAARTSSIWTPMACARSSLS